MKSERDPEVFEELVNNLSGLQNKNAMLKEEIAVKNDDIEDLKRSVEVKVKVAERLKAELRENRIKAEKDKAAMGKAHRSEVKLWRKDLGEDTLPLNGMHKDFLCQKMIFNALCIIYHN